MDKAYEILLWYIMCINPPIFVYNIYKSAEYSVIPDRKTTNSIHLINIINHTFGCLQKELQQQPPTHRQRPLFIISSLTPN